MKIKFYFQKPKLEVSALMVSVSWNGLRLQTAIGLSSPTSSFDIENQIFKRNISKSAQLNNILTRISQEISNYYFNSQAANIIIDKSEMSNKLKQILNKEDEEVIEPDDVIKEYKLSDIIHSFVYYVENSPMYKKSTAKRYRNLRNNTLKYIKKNSDPNVNKLDYKYVFNFAIFLSKVLKFNDATIQKTLKMVSVTLNKAFDDGLIETQYYKPIFKKVFKELKLKTESHRFALTKEDILKISNYIPTSDILQLTKDMFLFEIYTSIRISDFHNVTDSSININERVLSFRQTKTNEIVTIPLIQKAIDIISKYPNMQFTKITEQHYNRNIKVLALEAGLTDTIRIERKSLNKVETIVKQKWELLASHHARVTGIVNMAQNGALPEEIISVSGHSSASSIQPYMKIAASEKKRRARLALEKAFE